MYGAFINPGDGGNGNVEEREISMIELEEWSSLDCFHAFRRMFPGNGSNVDISEKSRLDYLFASDVKMWKEVRISLKELYISTMIVGGDEFKKLMGMLQRYAIDYNIPY